MLAASSMIDYPSQQIHSSEREINKYQNLKSVFEVVKIAGIVALVASPIFAALFFGAPIIPTGLVLTAVALALFVPLIIIGLSPAPAKPYNIDPGPEVLGAGATGVAYAIGWVTKTFYFPIAKFVYAPKVAMIAGGTFTGIGAVGGALLGIGMLGEHYCNRKVAKLQSQ